MKATQLKSLVLGTALVLGAASVSEAAPIAPIARGGIAAAVALTMASAGGPQFSNLSPKLQAKLFNAPTVVVAVDALTEAGIRVNPTDVYGAMEGPSLNLAAAQSDVGAPSSVNFIDGTFALSNAVSTADCNLSAFDSPTSSSVTRKTMHLQTLAAEVAQMGAGLVLSPNFLTTSVNLLNPADGAADEAVALGYAALVPEVRNEVQKALDDGIVTPAEASCTTFNAAANAALAAGHSVADSYNMAGQIATHCSFGAVPYAGEGSCSMTLSPIKGKT